LNKNFGILNKKFRILNKIDVPQLKKHFFDVFLTF